MINPEGTWAADGLNSCGPHSTTFTQEGEAWTVVCSQTPDFPRLLGVGFTHGNFLCVARGHVEQQADLGEIVGLVKYDISQFGELPATWYHCSLNGRLSRGLSSDGPTETLFGEYRADYSSGDGIAFNALRKTIARENNCMRFAWWDNERFHYLGVGQTMANSLFAAWGPPGALVQFVCYDLASENTCLRGRWWDLGRGYSGHETLVRS